MYRLHIVVLGCDIAKLLDIPLSLIILVAAHHSYTNLLVERRQSVLVLVEHLLVELLTLTQSGVLYLHILGSTEQNHTSCKVGYAHRLAHIEDEYLATLAVGTSLEHQLTSLGDKHKEAYNLRMRYRKRTTGCELLAEQRYNRTV